MAGFQPIMPTFQGLVTEEQLLQLIAYIKSLGGPPAERDGAAGDRRHRGGRPARLEIRVRGAELREDHMDTTTTGLNYLNNGHGMKSWLLTRDHKRIALLYLISITAFFVLGGFFALMIRLELLTPAADLVQPETYNKLFTMHGVVMVFFFLIPSIPAVLGNFLLPIMVGREGPGVSAHQPVELVHLHSRRHVHVVAAVTAAASTPGGPSTRRTARRHRTHT